MSLTLLLVNSLDKYLSGPEVNEEEEKEDECNRFTPQEVKEAIFREHSTVITCK
jgi:hypothetical protein